ncbi:MAG: hypothetical protein ACPLYF_03355, partial [Fervidobacterium sp.]
MLTREDIERLKELVGDDDIIRKLEFAAEDYVQLKKQDMELKEALNKMIMNRKARQYLKEAFQSAELPYEIPEPPGSEEVKEVRDEIENIKKSQWKQKIFETLQEYGLSESELPEIAKFQQEHGIANDLSAIRLYALSKKQTPELEPVYSPEAEILRNPEEFRKSYNEKQAYE